MSSKNNISHKIENDNNGENEWLKIVYEEAWRQYVHEDEMAEQRDSKYLTIVSVFFSAIGVGMTIFITYFEKSQVNNIYIKVSIFVALIVLSFLLLTVMIMLIYWDNINSVGREYTIIRFEVAKEIERKLNLSINLAESEEERLLRIHKKSDKLFEGFSSTHSIIKSLKLVIWILLIIDVIAFIITAINFY